MRILVEGWTNCPHSYAIVNVYQLVALSKLPDVKLYLKEMELFRKEWPTFQSLVGLMLTDEENATVKAIEPYKEGTKVDIVYRISFPHNITPSPDRVPVVVFYTAEFKKLDPVNFTPGTGDFDTLVTLMKKGKVAAVTPSKWSRDAFSRKTRAKCGNFLKVVPHGVDVKKFYPDELGRATLRTALGISPSDVVFLNVGAMTGNKNIPSIIQAFYELCQKKPNVRLLLKGINSLYDCERAVYQQLSMMFRVGKMTPEIFEKCVGSRITYLDGPMGYSSLRELYNVADAYVSPYIAEGFNMPVLEAQACGTPLIISGGGPTADFVHPDCAIVLPTEENAAEGYHRLDTKWEDIHSAMLRIVEDGPSISKTCKVVGPAHVQENYTWDIVAGKLVRYFTSLI